jgi:hypothetical protein
MKEDGVHQNFWGSMPEMPWRKKMKIYVNGQEREISLRAYNILRIKVVLDDDPRECCTARLAIGYLCTCVEGHKHPHIAHGADENNNPVFAVEIRHD